jgi:ubiquinone/menaquinone biosynthesis C-methylase UbiE
MNPLYKAHYALWVYWWPLWRSISSPAIIRQWEQVNLVKEGQTFLDYGCGTGDFSIIAAKMVGEEGRVFAADYFSRQLEIVEKRSTGEGLNNIETILTRGNTGLPDKYIDVIWLCDVLHEIEEKRKILKELHRIIKPDGVLAIHDGMKGEVLNYTAGLFSLLEIDDKFIRLIQI